MNIKRKIRYFKIMKNNNNNNRKTNNNNFNNKTKDKKEECRLALSMIKTKKTNKHYKNNNKIKVLMMRSKK